MAPSTIICNDYAIFFRTQSEWNLLFIFLLWFWFTVCDIFKFTFKVIIPSIWNATSYQNWKLHIPIKVCKKKEFKPKCWELIESDVNWMLCIASASAVITHFNVLWAHNNGHFFVVRFETKNICTLYHRKIGYIFFFSVFIFEIIRLIVPFSSHQH